SYALYLETLASVGDRERRAHARAAARVARSNALASLERLRAEPATPTALLALIERLFAHASRLVRSAMALEATLGDTGSDPHAAIAAMQVRQLAARVRDPRATAASERVASAPAAAGDAARARLHARIADALAALRHALDEATA
ncbi:MAG: FUSC family protein, partial [Xanthomonadaceae bacterium]|nr:FUSC family protein [Xanthomonadaceae bacterium]